MGAPPLAADTQNMPIDLTEAALRVTLFSVYAGARGTARAIALVQLLVH